MNRNNQSGDRPNWVRWLFLLIGPLLLVQFAYATLIHKTFPGLTMPSFAVVPTMGDSILQSTQHRIEGYTCAGDTITATMEKVFAQVSPVGARMMVDRVLFYRSLSDQLTPQRQAFYDRLSQKAGKGVVNYILKNRYPPVDPTDIQALDQWIRNRMTALFPDQSFCRGAVIRTLEEQHLQRQEILDVRELDRYSLSYE